MIYEYSTSSKIRKLFRFVKIYGFSRTYVKIIGRKRKYTYLLKLPIRFKFPGAKNIAVIGCGQCSFSTIAYYLKSAFGNVIYGAYDINMDSARSFASYYKCKVFENPLELLKDENVQFVYIASNHHSHTTYAIEALKNNKTVYVEKPISVNKGQLNELLKFKKDKALYTGYNRPFAPIIKLVSSNLDIGESRNPMSINYTIIGHKIPKDHWYRNIQEGTRICGNLGHWIDLSIHLLSKIGYPKTLNVSIHSSSKEEKDDNLVIVLTSELGDCLSIMFSSREEPFEGISEHIIIQHQHLIAKIDDFKSLTLWKNEKKLRKKYLKKNVGHREAIMQPFEKKDIRDFNEIELSTRLMLEIVQSLENDVNEFIFSLKRRNDF